jgi:NAD(P)H-dependent flavin oxidoreductase YrpB (nitropropane dioxygenase family)
MTFDPRVRFGPRPPDLRRPRLDAIVASLDLAEALVADPATRPDGFVVEGHQAGGHNAPPRGPRRLDDIGQPVYDGRDVVTPDALARLGLPYWMALAVSNPEVRVRTDARASPTGFPFKVADLPGTLADEQVYRDRPRICDLGVLRSPYRKPDGSVGFRCPAEPIDVYTERRGGRVANTVGRRCLCNALMAAAGLPQLRSGGYVEPPIVTAGTDFTGVRHMLARAPDGETYTARDAVAYLLDGLSPRH